MLFMLFATWMLSSALSGFSIMNINFIAKVCTILFVLPSMEVGNRFYLEIFSCWATFGTQLGIVRLSWLWGVAQSIRLFWLLVLLIFAVCPFGNKMLHKSFHHPLDCLILLLLRELFWPWLSNETATYQLIIYPVILFLAHRSLLISSIIL